MNLHLLRERDKATRVQTCYSGSISTPTLHEDAELPFMCKIHRRSYAKFIPIPSQNVTWNQLHPTPPKITSKDLVPLERKERKNIFHAIQKSRKSLRRPFTISRTTKVSLLSLLTQDFSSLRCNSSRKGNLQSSRTHLLCLPAPLRVPLTLQKKMVPLQW